MIGTWQVGGAFVRRAQGLRALTQVIPCLWVLGVICWELLTPHDTEVVPLLAAAPAIACASSGRRRCILLLGGASLLFALAPPTALEPDGAEGPHASLVSCCAILAVVVASYLTNGRRLRLVRELEQMRAVAAAAQDAVLRPLPARLDGVEVAVGYLSASRGAAVGGDLYEALATAHGLRVVIGDARGHGLGAISTVAAVLGSFREAAHDEPELADVLRRLDRALQRHLRERALGEPLAGEELTTPVAEEFVTVLVLDVAPDGEVTALNCGHPWPYLLSENAAGAARVRRLAPAEVLPPLGPFPLPDDLPAARCDPLQPGDALVLHTDGAEDARDAHGTFFELGPALARAAGTGPIDPAALIEGVRTAVLRHTGGRLADDVALLALRNEMKTV